MDNKPTIAIIDYGAGNLRSVVNAFHSLGYLPEVTAKPAAILKADMVVLPGVGAGGDTVASLKRLGFVEPVRQVVAAGKPFLGVCIGLQVLFTGTEEDGWHECLDIIKGKVRRLPPGLKTPHMGWNQVKQTISHSIFEGIPDNTNFYFVHSYYAVPEDRSIVAGETEYGIEFCSMVVRDNLIATQFHPEKSGDMGLKMYDNFVKMASRNNIR